MFATLQANMASKQKKGDNQRQSTACQQRPGAEHTGLIQMLVNQRDPVATANAGFFSKKSYVSFAGHVYLHGVKDHEMMRHLIYDRAKGMCQGCDIPHFVNWYQGHWCHIQKTFGGRRCDGPCCGIWACVLWHEQEHGRELTAVG